MATFDPIPYTYKPTAPRSKSAATHCKPAFKQFKSLDELQHTESKSTPLDGPRLPSPTTSDSDKGYEARIQDTINFHDGSDDDELPSLEDILCYKLPQKGFTATDLGSENAVRRGEVALKGGGSMNHNKPGAGHDVGSSNHPIDLRREDDSSAFEAEDGGDNPRDNSATPNPSVFDNASTSVGSTIPASPSSSSRWYDIDEFPETAPGLHLAEHEVSTSNSMRPCSFALSLSSALQHNRVYVEDCNVMESHSDHVRSSPSGFSRGSQENAIGRVDQARVSRSRASQHELPSSAFDTDAVDEGERQEVEQEDQFNDENGKGQFPMNDATAVKAAERVSDTMMDDGLGLAQRPRFLPPSDPSTSHDKMESRRDGDNDREKPSDHDSDGEPDNRFESDQENGIPPKRKRKQPCSSFESVRHKKHKSTRQPNPNSKPRRRSPKSNPSRDQTWKVAALSIGEAQLPRVVFSPVPSASQAMRSKMPSNHDFSEPPGNKLPTLTEITFRPQSRHCFSFTALIRDGGDVRGVSIAQLIQLIESTGPIGRTSDLAIKPIDHQSFLVTGLSQHASSRRSSSRTTMSIAAKASSISEEGCSNDHETVLGESDLDLSSGDDAESSSEDKPVHFNPRKRGQWTDLEEQRLLAYKKEGKPWEWIFQKFPGRTQPAIRTRWSMIRSRDK